VLLSRKDTYFSCKPDWFPEKMKRGKSERMRLFSPMFFYPSFFWNILEYRRKINNFAIIVEV